MYKKVYRQVGGALPSTIPRQHVGLLGVLPGAPPLSGTPSPQNQGLSGLDPHSYMRKTVDDYVKSYNIARQGTGNTAQRVMERPRLVAGTGLRSIREGVGDQTIKPLPSLGDLYNQDKIIELAVRYGEPVGATGKASDARHMAAINELSKTLSPGIIPDIVGDIGAFGLGALAEIPALGRGLSKENLEEIKEDISANWRGSFGTPNITTPEEIYKNIYEEPVDEYGGISALPEAQPTTPAIPEEPPVALWNEEAWRRIAEQPGRELIPYIDTHHYNNLDYVTALPESPITPTTPAIPEVPTTPPTIDDRHLDVYVSIEPWMTEPEYPIPSVWYRGSNLRDWTEEGNPIQKVVELDQHPRLWDEGKLLQPGDPYYSTVMKHFLIAE